MWAHHILTLHCKQRYKLLSNWLGSQCCLSPTQKSQFDWIEFGPAPDTVAKILHNPVLSRYNSMGFQSDGLVSRDPVNAEKLDLELLRWLTFGKFDEAHHTGWYGCVVVVEDMCTAMVAPGTMVNMDSTLKMSQVSHTGCWLAALLNRDVVRSVFSLSRNHAAFVFLQTSRRFCLCRARVCVV